MARIISSKYVEQSILKKTSHPPLKGDLIVEEEPRVVFEKYKF